MDAIEDSTSVSLMEDAGLLTLEEDVADEARFFVYSYNATTLVTTAGLALGLFFIITAIALYYFYYVEAGLSRDEKFKYKEYRDDPNKDVYVDVLELLEKAWVIYAVETQDCRRRLVCEAHLPSAGLLNEPVAGVLTELLGQVTEDMLGQVDEGLAASVRDLQLAAQYGRTVRSCQAYERHCRDLQLASLSQN